jgi:uncharacterized phiE125 gp8 family phage protein
MKDYNLTLITPPSVEPLLLTDVKPYLRLDDVTDTSDDSYITSLITVAREYCEEYQHRAYITQTWELAFQKFVIEETDTLNNNLQKSIIEIPKGNLQAINSFTYMDTAAVVTTMQPNTDYVVSIRGILGRVAPPFGKIFPVCLLYPLDPIVINFTCGYGDDGTKVPQRIKQAMFLLISHWYDNRMVINDLRGVNPEEISFAVTSLLMKDKITIL